MTEFYNKVIKRGQRRYLRKNMPLAEVLLWQEIKNNKLGYKFRRQYSIENYIVDFYCPKRKIAIEVDGNSHFKDKKAKNYDEKRQKFLESFGITFLRFTNREIYLDLENVLNKISKC